MGDMYERTKQSYELDMLKKIVTAQAEELEKIRPKPSTTPNPLETQSFFTSDFSFGVQEQADPNWNLCGFVNHPKGCNCTVETLTEFGKVMEEEVVPGIVETMRKQSNVADEAKTRRMSKPGDEQIAQDGHGFGHLPFDDH